MVNSWSLLYEVLNGTMDETYPVKDDKNEDSINLDFSAVGAADTVPIPDMDISGIGTDMVTFSGDSTVLGGSNYYLDNPSPFDTNINLSDNDDQIAHHVAAGSTASVGYDTLNIGFGSHLPGAMGEDHITISPHGNYANARPVDDDPWIYESPDGGNTVTRRRRSGNSNDREILFGDYFKGNTWMDLSVKKPEPDLNYKSHKYQEDKGIADLKDYVSSTYKGHYTNENSDVQTLDLIHSVGDAESFCRSNALKYLSRNDKKGSAKRDILKAMHYCLLLYYFSGNTNNETPTRGYETF